MKKILAALTTLSIILPTTTGLVSCSNKNKITEIEETIRGDDGTSHSGTDPDPKGKEKVASIDYSANNFKSIIKLLNKYEGNEENMKFPLVDSFLDESVIDYYKSILTNNSTRVKTGSTSAPKGSSEKIFERMTFINERSVVQEYQTIGYEFDINRVHKIKMQLADDFEFKPDTKINGQITIPLNKILVDLNFDFNLAKSSDGMKEIEFGMEASLPIQTLTVRPYTKLTFQGGVAWKILNFEGIASFKIDDSEILQIPFFHLTEDGEFDYVTGKRYPLNEIIEILFKMGYRDKIINNSPQKHSLFGFNDKTNETFLNLPVSGKFEVPSYFFYKCQVEEIQEIQR